MLTLKLSFCLSSVSVGKLALLMFMIFLKLWSMGFNNLVVCFGTLSINAIDPKTKKILQLLRLRQVSYYFILILILN